MASGSLPSILRLGSLGASSLSEALGEEGLGAGTEGLGMGTRRLPLPLPVGSGMSVSQYSNGGHLICTFIVFQGDGELDKSGLWGWYVERRTSKREDER